MARYETTYIVTEDNRDKNKHFKIIELPTSQAEAWAIRALLAIMASGMQLPEGFERSGMAGMAELGIRALSRLKWDDAKPLLDEMFECVQYMPDPSKPGLLRKPLDVDIEEISTRVKLRAEVWNLHTGFLKAASPSKLEGQAATVALKGPNTKTYRR